MSSKRSSFLAPARVPARGLSVEAQRNRLAVLALWILAWSAGIGLLVWAVSAPQFRDAEGYLEGNVALPFSAGLALLGLGWGILGRWRHFSFWLSLAAVGQAVSLQMIDAGPAIHYQHLRPFGELALRSPGLLLLAGLQALLVAAGLRSRWSALQIWLRRTFRPWQLLLIALGLLFPAAAGSRQLALFAGEIILAVFLQLLSLANLLLVVWALPVGSASKFLDRVMRFFGSIPFPAGKTTTGLDRFALAGAIWVFLATAALNTLIYQAHPHIQDEVMYLYQARYFAEGRLTVPAPPVPEAFTIFMIPFRSAQWYSIFPPGWSALLALGVLLGAPGLVNPFLTALNLLFAFLLLRDIFDRPTARLAVLLLCLSPWYIFMGMSFLSHMLTLTLALAGALCMGRARATGRARFALLSGLAVGLLSLVRPQDAAIAGALLGLWSLGIGGWGRRIAAGLAFGLAALAGAALILPYNAGVIGDPLVFPLTAYFADYFGPLNNAFGFGPGRGMGWSIDPFPGHSPLESLINANFNLSMLNGELFGWSLGSLLPAAVLLVSRRLDRREAWMAAVILGTALVYSLYWFSGGPDFGPRYWYLMLLPLTALTVRGLRLLGAQIEPGRAGLPGFQLHVLAAVLALSLFSALNYLPWRAIDKYFHYLGMRPDLRTLAVEHGFGRSLVFVQGELHPDYESAWVYNPLNLQADAPIYVQDQDAVGRQRLVEAFPDRPIWIVAGPSLTGKSYQVIQSP